MALVGLCLNRFTSLAKRLGQVTPLKKGATISHADAIRSYIGLLSLGKSDFEAISGFRQDRYFQEALKDNYKVRREVAMNFADEWLEPLLILIVVVAIMVMGATGFYQYLDKARLTLSIAALNKAQDTLKSYKAMHRSFPASLDFSNCSDQDHLVVLRCEEVKADINSFVSYVGTAETFVLKAKAKDTQETFITVTESVISF